MNNLYRELAPISDAAWEEIEAEARRTFVDRAAARKVVDVTDAAGFELSAVGTGHVVDVDSAVDGVRARRREVAPVIELRVPFSVSRDAVDAVDRGAQDADWSPVIDAARQIATAEDRTVLHGASGIEGVAASSSNAQIALPDDVRAYPAAVARAISALRLAGVGGPYTLLLSADAYTAVAETTDYGYPIRDHINRLMSDGRSTSTIVWAPAIDGALLISERGGDYQLRLGQDLSIGYLRHDDEQVDLYLQESFTFLVNTDEASVVLGTDPAGQQAPVDQP